jgi:hypothetical protein
MTPQSTLSKASGTRQRGGCLRPRQSANLPDCSVGYPMKFSKTTSKLCPQGTSTKCEVISGQSLRLEGKDDVSAKDEDDKDGDVQHGLGDHAPALVMDIVVQDDAQAVGAVEPGKD